MARFGPDASSGREAERGSAVRLFIAPLPVLSKRAPSITRPQIGRRCKYSSFYDAKSEQNKLPNPRQSLPILGRVQRRPDPPDLIQNTKQLIHIHHPSTFALLRRWEVEQFLQHSSKCLEFPLCPTLSAPQQSGFSLKGGVLCS